MVQDDRIPYFPLYVDDFVSDGKVEAMDTLEVGAYWLLLCKSWRERPVASIPNDSAVLARWARVGADIWERIEARVLAPFTLGKDGRLYQKRLRKEYDKMLAHRRERQKSGKKGAERLWKDRRQIDGKPWLSHSSAIREPMAKNGSSSSSAFPEESKTPKAPDKPPAGGADGKYEIKTPLQFVVAGFKAQKGYEVEDRAWDAANFKRTSGAARQLLVILGNDQEKAVQCIAELGAAFDKKGLSWTLETIVKNAYDWLHGKNGGRD
jgi:uncharacterized protein YdaU (DUF1376 family)